VLHEVTLVARPAEVLARLAYVQVFPRVPADLADVRHVRSRPQIEAERVAQTVVPDLRLIGGDVAVVEGVGRKTITRGRIDMHDLAAERAQVLCTQRQGVDHRVAGAVAAGDVHAAIGGELHRANRVGQVVRGQAVVAGREAFARWANPVAEDHEFAGD